MEGFWDRQEGRRNFLVKSSALLGLTTLAGLSGCVAGPEKTPGGLVTPTEDLMFEHGLLQRLMLIYDEMVDRLQWGAEVPLGVLADANDIVRRFIQDYHEKSEEEYLFPRFSKAGKLVELAAVLYQQHGAGRKVIDRLKTLSTAESLKNPEERSKIAEYLQSFNRLYRPHAAREDSVLFPAFRSVVSPKEFADLGKLLEEKEQKLFGKDGFEKIVAQVADLEKNLGIYELLQFSPKNLG